MFFRFLLEVQTIAMSVYVCLSICLSVCCSHISETTWLNFVNFYAPWQSIHNLSQLLWLHRIGRVTTSDHSLVACVNGPAHRPIALFLYFCFYQLLLSTWFYVQPTLWHLIADNMLMCHQETTHSLLRVSESVSEQVTESVS